MAQGTVLVTDSRTGGGLAQSYPRLLINVGGKVLFSAIVRGQDAVRCMSVWPAQGPPRLLRCGGFTSSSAVSDGAGIEVVGDSVYLSGLDGVRGMYLWKSGGTAAETILVQDIHLGPGSSSPRYLTNVNGTLFFD